MNCNLFHWILIGMFVTGISEIKADNTVVNPSVDSSSSFVYPGLATPSIVSVQPVIPVNEEQIRAGLLYDAVSKKVIWQKNISTAYPIASLTKMMVAFLTVEDVRAGKFNWTDNVKWAREIIVGRGKHRKKVSSEVSYSL